MAKSSNYIDQVGDYFDKLPALPKGGRDFFVMILPWLALIFGILGVWGAISTFGLLNAFMPSMYWGGAQMTGMYTFSIILTLVSSVLLLVAFPGLKNRREKGWRFIYYAQIVSLVANIVIFSLFGILMTLVGFYILYQIRGSYK